MKTKWFDTSKRGKAHAILFIDSVGSTINTNVLKDAIGTDYKTKNYRQFDNKRSIGYEDYENISKIVKELLEKTPEKYLFVFEDVEGISNEIIKWTDKIKDSKFEEQESTELLRHIKTIDNFQKRLWKGPFVYAYYFYFNDIFLEKFIEDLKQNKVLDENLLKFITTPENITLIGKEKQELLKLAKDYFNKKEIDKDKLRKHCEKYSFLNRYYFWGKGYTLEDIENRLNEIISKKEDYINKELERLKPHEINLEKYNLTDYQKTIIKLARKSSYAMNFADEATNYCIHNLDSLFNEIAKRLDINHEQLVSMRVNEVGKSLKENQLTVPKNELDLRLKDHALIFTDGESKILIREELENYKKSQIIEKFDTLVNKLKGVTAFSSEEKVIGKVRIIKDVDNLKNFKQDEILVTPMTNPTYIQIMEKSKAIITDEGGMLCHAAIISREMEKPCIIGTKIATQILKDGDLIEVDANKGTIKILNRKP